MNFLAVFGFFLGASILGSTKCQVYTGNSGTSDTFGNAGNGGSSFGNGNSFGSSGNVEPFGNSGSFGNNGNTGSIGNSGSFGNTGNTGSFGNNGNTGSFGNNGNTGSFGNNGNTGSFGNNGNTGSFGNSGNTEFGYGNSGSGSYVPAQKEKCAVSTIKAQPMFDKKSFEGDWRVIRRTSMKTIDPVMSLLNMFSDSIFFQLKTHSMRARVQSTTEGLKVYGSTTRSMTLFGISWDTCQSIPALELTPEDPTEPGRLTIRFRAIRALRSLFGYESSSMDFDLGGFMKGLFGEDYFDVVVLSTDYQNYAVVWSCRSILPKGKCAENQVLVMSRGKKLSPYHEQIIKAKLASICVDYDFLETEVQSDDGTC